MVVLEQWPALIFFSMFVPQPIYKLTELKVCLHKIYMYLSILKCLLLGNLH